MKRWIAWLVTVALLLSALPAMAEEVAPSRTLLQRLWVAATEEEQHAALLQAVLDAPEDAELLLTAAQCVLLLGFAPDLCDQAQGWLDVVLPQLDEEQRAWALQLSCQIYLDADRPEDALTVLDGMDDDGMDPDTLAVLRGGAMMLSGREDEAISYLEDFVASTDDSYGALSFLGEVYLDNCRFDDAVAVFQKMDKRFPESTDGLIGLYNAYLSGGRYDRTLRVLDELLFVTNDDSLFFERVSVWLWWLHDPEQALKEVMPILLAEPVHVRGLAVKAICLTLLGRFDEAEGVLVALLPLDPAWTASLSAYIALVQGDTALAKERLEAAIAHFPEDDRAPLAYALLLSDQLDLGEQALATLSTLFEKYDGQVSSDVWLNVGTVRMHQGDLEEAARAFLYASQMTGDDAQPLYRMAMVCLSAGRADDAQKTVDALNRHYPGTYEAMTATAVLQELLCDFPAAETLYRQMIAKFPFIGKEFGAILAAVQVRNGAVEEGVATALLLSGAEDATPETLSEAAYVLALSGRADEARALSARAIAALNGGDVSVLAGVIRANAPLIEAELAMQAGDASAAIAACAQAVSLGYPAGQLRLWVWFDELVGEPDFVALIGGIDLPLWDLTQKPEKP